MRKSRFLVLLGVFAALFLVTNVQAFAEDDEEEDSEGQDECVLTVANGTSYSFNVTIDGQKAGKVEPGSKLVIEGVPYGTHNVQAVTTNKKFNASAKLALTSATYTWKLSDDGEDSEEDSDEDEE